MLEVEAGHSGVSVAHYIRDAALARLAYAAGQRSAEDVSFAWADPRSSDARAASAESHRQVEGATAVQAQARLAAARAAALRDEAGSVRRSTGRGGG